MKRRAFLALLTGLPVVGGLVASGSARASEPKEAERIYYHYARGGADSLEFFSSLDRPAWMDGSLCHPERRDWRYAGCTELSGEEREP